MIKTAKQISGFTLIELLVVLAVLAVVAGAVVTTINPLQQINRGNDGKVKSDIGQIATAIQAYYTVFQSYPSTTTDLTVSKDLTSWPTPPTGYSAYTIDVKPTSPACAGTTASPCTS